MNKQDFVSKIAEKANLTKAAAAAAVNAYHAVVTEELANGGTIDLPGFGKFGVSERAAREGRNPQTGEMVHIEAAKLPKFKAGKSLKDAVK